jgi:hypothetical protein
MNSLDRLLARIERFRRQLVEEQASMASSAAELQAIVELLANEDNDVKRYAANLQRYYEKHRDELKEAERKLDDSIFQALKKLNERSEP